jgi:uncharacterized protein YbaR (Trm112 family)
MTPRDQVIHTLQSHKAELAATYGVRSLARFGSLARDEATEHSDVDPILPSTSASCGTRSRAICPSCKSSSSCCSLKVDDSQQVPPQLLQFPAKRIYPLQQGIKRWLIVHWLHLF